MKNRPTADRRNLIMGRNCVREVLQQVPGNLEKVYCSVGGGEPAGAAGALVKLARDLDVEVEFMSPDAMSEMLGSGSHQSFAAVVRTRPSLGLKELLAKVEGDEKSLILCLDEVMDPHNLGAIFRAAECFGVDALLWSKNRGVGLTPTVAKSSVGASELVPSVQVSNLADSLRKLKDAGFWVIAADVSEGAISLDSFEFPNKTALVLGSEGEGLSRLIKEISDVSVFIPLYGKIKSLNVSQATALLLSDYRRKCGDRQS